MPQHSSSIMRNPLSLDDCIARDELLRECLRNPLEFGIKFSIRDEYPIVLNPKERQFSHLIYAEQKPIAHLNAWPRSICNQQGDHQFDILLIGNVCSHPKFRHRGLIRQLLEQAQNLYPKSSALVLWSDLDQFYQKLGFSSLNQEVRFSFNGKSLTEQLVNPKNTVQIINTSAIKMSFSNLLKIRPDTPLRLTRSQQEMQRLLSIPESHYLWLGEAKNPRAYGFIGKGADLQGVIHEWGAHSIEDMIELLASVMSACSLEDLMLLAPATLNEDWQKILRHHAEKSELHSMALAKAIGDFDLSRLYDLFIWGFDSI